MRGIDRSSWLGNRPILSTMFGRGRCSIYRRCTIFKRSRTSSRRMGLALSKLTNAIPTCCQSELRITRLQPLHHIQHTFLSMFSYLSQTYNHCNFTNIFLISFFIFAYSMYRGLNLLNDLKSTLIFDIIIYIN